MLNCETLDQCMLNYDLYQSWMPVAAVPCFEKAKKEHKQNASNSHHLKGIKTMGRLELGVQLKLKLYLPLLLEGKIFVHIW